MQKRMSRYILNIARLYTAVAGIIIGMGSLVVLDALKVDKPMSAQLDARRQYAQAMITARLAEWSKEAPGKPTAELIKDMGPKAISTHQPITLAAFIRELDEQTAPAPTTLGTQLGDPGSPLHYAYDLSVAACIAVITVCGLYLLYALAHWLKLPTDAAALPKLGRKPDVEKPASGAAKALAAGTAGIASMVSVTPVTMAALAAIVSGTLVVRHVDGKDGIRGPEGQMGAPGVAGQAGTPGAPDAGRPTIIDLPIVYKGPPIPIEVTTKPAEQHLEVRADASWTANTASLNAAAIKLAETTHNLVDYGNILRDTSRQNWAEVHKQLSMVALGSSSLLENSRLAHQRANTAMATLLGRDCYRQATEAYIIKSSVNIESELSNLRNRIQKEPCADLSQTAAQR